MAFNATLGQIGGNDFLQELSPTASATERLDKINELVRFLNELRKGISVYDESTRRVWIGPDSDGSGNWHVKVSDVGHDAQTAADGNLLVKLPV